LNDFTTILTNYDNLCLKILYIGYKKWVYYVKIMTILYFSDKMKIS